ncbi:hypothetical protein OIDMADRAFT_43392 [Oidiodendron maius Zn]|uniref:Uncharacterized protein n=1 Tax=Oidiodendron maius (strain Zn) TaxID=913774 RepID=A0A0C3D8Y7_OIDMZ|nr:hypothetical protein OIDMADRAFT_43392 [Oidiodendron maius Zn]
MLHSKAVNSLENFKRLNGSVYIHDPTTTTSSENHPDLILIAGWMNASPRHVSKYTAGYQKLYPSARILAITTTSLDAAFSTHGANLKRIAPVLDILYTLRPNSKLLLHFFSDGGSFTSTLIARKYQERMGRPLPAKVVILDSSPGRATYEAGVRAFSVALPKNIVLKVIGILLLRLFYGFYKCRVDLNTKSLFDIDAPRLYIYSVADDMISWQFVEEHCNEAKKLGYTVNREKFMDSSHCGHLMTDEKRYWAAVLRLWSAV